MEVVRVILGRDVFLEMEGWEMMDIDIRGSWDVFLEMERGNVKRFFEVLRIEEFFFGW